MHAKDVMRTEATAISPNATLREAARTLVNTQVSSLPVVDEGGAMVGIVSEIDLITRVMGADLSENDADDSRPATALAARVSDVMSKEVVAAAEESSLADMAALMVKHRTKRIPIVRGRTLVGVVSRIDLVKAMLSREEAAAASPALPGDALRGDVATAVYGLGFPLGATFDVVVHNGTAHLWGQVTEAQQERVCCRTAADVPGVLQVISHLQILPPRKLRR